MGSAGGTVKPGHSRDFFERRPNQAFTGAALTAEPVVAVTDVASAGFGVAVNAAVLTSSIVSVTRILDRLA